MSSSITAVVLAAGKGTRMKSALPKVLHKVCGRPILEHILNMLDEAGVGRIIVVAGYGAEEVSALCSGRAEIALQTEQLGTGHAVMMAAPLLQGNGGTTLVLPGDTPLLRADTMDRLCRLRLETGAGMVLLSAEPDDPGSYGRIVRGDGGTVKAIVEAKDAGPEELKIREINAAVYAFDTDLLLNCLTRIGRNNAQGEYYLTDVVSILSEEDRVEALIAEDPDDIIGINDRLYLSQAGKIMRSRILEAWMLEGITIIDPDSTFIEDSVNIGRDTVIHPFSIIEGETFIGEGCSIGPNAHLTDARLGKGVNVQNSTVLDSDLDDGVSVGPYAYIRPGNRLGEGARAGSFVEIKNSEIGPGSAVPHLSYIGDSSLGADVNIGAGTITCNYDGREKHRTVIGNEAFIGSNTKLIAPVTVGEGAVTGAGAVVNKDVPPWKVAVGMPARVIKRRDWGKGNHAG
ncbi:MAG: bifunctional UDP-N-acetylglucosamine diphosphorylase/glucosamine-1-phosphate N-acetyltransferase GlmU [bacterium]|nr:bifunctional UDP-N-acetylglucosamine diphosphorylase/glucosamine-1-phosphate N-acetyltransferase GlmU [bacterium]